MKLSEFSVKHPVIITMLLIVLFGFGLYSLSGMNQEFIPDITMPQAIVISIYPGASAEDVEQDVTKILEDDFVTLPNFKSMDSSSYNSFSLITITYRDGVAAEDQLEELRNRISDLKDSLPEGLQGNPTPIVGGMGMMPICTFTVSAGKDTARVTQFIEDELTPSLTRINGVSEISVDGNKELQVNVKLNIDELVSKGISVTTVYQILNYGNVSLPLGIAGYEGRTIQIRYSGDFKSIEDIKNLPVGVADGTSIIHLSDVAEVSFIYPESEYYVTDGDDPLVIVGVTKRSDGDTINIIKEIKKVLKKYEKQTGGAVQFHIISDDSRQVSASMKTVISSGLMGIVFAILIIFLFMADWRATLTIGLSIPLCILFSFIGLKVFGMSINLLTLSGLVISLGMVVDGSTVMLEQIYRHYKKRTTNGLMEYTVSQSIYKGWDEVAGSIIASVATTLVVFIPIALLNGLPGKVLHDLSVTIIMAMLASLFVALIVVPYLLKLLLNEDGPKVRTKPRRFDVFMDKLEAWYKNILVDALDNRKFVIILSVVVLIISGFTATRLGVAFIPSTDAGDFYISVEFPVGTRIENTRRKMARAEKLLYQYVPEIQSIVCYEGMSNSSSLMTMSKEESGYIHVVLTPVSERKRGVHEIMYQMQEIWSASLPDATVNVQNGGFDKLVSYLAGDGYGLTLISEDTETLFRAATDIKNFLLTDSEVVNARLDTNFDTTSMVIDMSQEYLSSLGLTSYEAGITSAILFQGINAGRYKDEDTGERYDIHISSDITDKNISADEIANIHIITDKGQDVSFANLSDIRVENAISQINHSDRAKTITVSATLTTEDTQGISRRVNEYIANNPLPIGVETKTGGLGSLVEDMIPPILAAMIIALFLTYTVMVIQFERFKQPLLIMVCIPFCFIGVVLGLLIFNSTLNLVSLLGVIALSGVVVNNGIILVDYINQLRTERRIEIAKVKGYQDRDGNYHVDLTEDEEEKLLTECVVDGSSSRIKPILITTLTTLLGDIPMAVATGEGAEIYAPMGQAIVGGMLTSTLITLVLIPILYYLGEHNSALKQSIHNTIEQKKAQAKEEILAQEAKLQEKQEHLIAKQEKLRKKQKKLRDKTFELIQTQKQLKSKEKMIDNIDGGTKNED